MMRRIVSYDREEKLFIGGVFVAILGVVVAAIFLISSDNETESRFMSECQADHKRYECLAMWRAGQNHTTVTPVPIVVNR